MGHVTDLFYDKELLIIIFVLGQKSYHLQQRIPFFVKHEFNSSIIEFYYLNTTFTEK